MNNGLKVLLVEDSEDDALLIIRVLEKANFSLIWQRIETEASLDHEINHKDWDIVISDYRLPGFDAQSALEIVKRCQKELPFIVVSGIIGETVAVEMMRSGAHDYLRKEKLHRLPEVVRREVREARVREEQKKTQIKLKQQSAAIEAAIDSMAIVQNNVFIYTNKAQVKLFGYASAEALIGQPWMNLYPPAQVECFEQEIFPILKGQGFWQGEALATRQDGSSFTQSLSLTLSEDGLLICVGRDISDRKLAEVATRQENRFRQQILENMVEGLCVYHEIPEFPFVRFTVWNRQMQVITGYTLDEINQYGWYQTLYPNPEIQTQAIARMEKMRQGSHLVNEEWVIQRKDGQHRCTSMSTSILSSEAGQTYVLLLIQDISERKDAEKVMRRQISAIEAAIDGIAILDNDHFLYLNPGYVRLFGYDTPEQLMGKAWQELYSPREIERFEREIFPMLEVNRAWQGEAIGTRKDGSTFEQGISLTFSEDNLLISVCRDISGLKQAQEVILHNALHDPLTDLPNRTLLIQRVEIAIQRARDDSKFQYAVLFLDLDRFKIINDSLGHLVGDQLLMAIAIKLKNHLRKSDLVARLGGDEFVILLDNIRETQTTISVVERIIRDFATPLNINGQTIFTSLSIGIVMGDSSYYRAADLIRDADTAMYRAKEEKKSSYKLFDTTMHTEAMDRLTLETDLRKAIENHEFTLYFQPIFNLLNNQLVGIEALIRWLHPTRGYVAPNQFIPIAKETGLIVEIDSWVFSIACQQIMKWKTKYSHLSSLKININLSAQDFHRTNLIEDIDQILANTGLTGDSIVLEITESILIEDIDKTVDLLTQLHSRGIQISIDDFGTGYSSLRYLHLLSVDSLKIDRSFVGNMKEKNEENQRITNRNYQVVSSIITLSNLMIIDTIAEGIDSTEQLKQLKALGCKFGQGYLFSEPISANEIEAKFLQSIQA